MQAISSLETNDHRFRDFMSSDVDELVRLGGRFFEESEFGEFSTFSPEHFRMVLANIENSPATHGFIFEKGGKIRGFIFYNLDLSYTEDPIALLWLFYVVPKLRKSPVGRHLLEIAQNHAKACKATAFYAGAMSGIPTVKNSLKNLYEKQGYEPLWWGRRIL
jgi:GNAT superfamily N-acetyltransferase